MAKQKAMSVYIDDETALALNSLREEIRQKNKSDGLPAQTPTIGWLARTLLRETLGMGAAKNDAPGVQ
ncbi:hypothetical protein V1577_22560 [Enterobacter bugandensis]|uniref:hypothetical protein n=1 Tax=Enterobacter bugandensis TaxID=881260 RepID=UPI002FD712D7